MPYQAEISRSNPSCFLFLIDQSGSMSDPFGEGELIKRKANGVADAINRLLQNLVIKCAKSEGVRDYYQVGVIGYGNSISSAFAGSLAGQDLSPISQIANSPARIEERTKKVDDGAGGLVDQTIKFPIWFDPVSNGGTPMCQAFDYGIAIIQNWLDQHPSCFPPVVIHITDGESTDGNPSEKMSILKNLASSDGNVLLFNLHLSSNPHAKTLSFPDNSVQLPDQYANMLFNGSSTLTPFMRNVAKEYGFNLSEGTKGFVLNGDLTLTIIGIEIGTRPSNLR